ncbi:MAG: ABC transporter ATP-binding protein [Thermoplasmata archaeon]|nr:ABC transporter ATP-binding protein [Thermoplasmata archaeon]
MTLEDYVRRRFALSENGYRNFVRSTISVVIHNISLMLPVMVLFVLVCDVMGRNAYDYDLGMWQYLAVCILVLAVMYVTYRWQYDCTFFRTYRESTEVRIAMAERIRRLPLSFFAKKDPTDLSSRVMGDVAVQESAMTHWFPELVGGMVFTAIVSVMVLVYSPLMGVAALWPVPFAIAIILLSKNVQRKYSDIKNERMLEVNEGVQECLEVMRDLRGNNAVGAYTGELFAKMDRVEGSEIRSELNTAVFVVSSQLLLKFGIVTTAIVGGWQLTTGGIDVFTFIVFLILVSRLYDPLNMSLQHLAAMISSEYNMARLQEIEDQPIQTGTTEFHPDGYDVVFDHVRFSYDGGARVLEDVSFTARQGEVTALVGPSGGGKSTTAKLASRFWDVDGGRITVGGVDISTVDPETLLSCYSIVFQDVTLFNTTVRDNIRIGRRGATDEEVLAAARAANCDEFVDALPDSYDTVIGENGAMLSGGERQRISIARALLKDAPIVLLDEATASLDTECESQVQAAISELVRDKTVIIVAHRMRTVEGADRIVVLADGTVAEQGSPRELMEEDGRFARMVRVQRSSDDWAI